MQTPSKSMARPLWTGPANFKLVKKPWYSDRRLSRGTFALQAHDQSSEVYFKNLMVKTLP